MESLVIYHSQFGNTRALAEIIGKALEAQGRVRVVSAESVAGQSLGTFDLLVVGGPTQAHGVSPGMQPFLDLLDSVPLGGKAAAIFDTRLRGPVFLWGSAANTIAEGLRRAGLTLVATQESFFVTMAKEPRLEAGEAERARAWAAELGTRVAAAQAAV